MTQRAVTEQLLNPHNVQQLSAQLRTVASGEVPHVGPLNIPCVAPHGAGVPCGALPMPWFAGMLPNAQGSVVQVMQQMYVDDAPTQPSPPSPSIM